MTTIQDINIHFPSKLVFGNGKIAVLKDELVRLNTRKVLLISIDPLLEKLQPVIEELKQNNIEVLLDTAIQQEPFFSDFEKLLGRVERFNPDTVVGVGGGSVLDIAKLVAAQLENEQSLKDYVGIGLL